MIRWDGIFACAGALGPGGLGYPKDKPWEFLFSPRTIARRFDGVISKTFTLNPRAGNYRSRKDAFRVLRWLSSKKIDKSMEEAIRRRTYLEYGNIYQMLLESRCRNKKVWPMAWINSIGLTNEGIEALEHYYFRAQKIGINLIPSIKGYNSDEWTELIKYVNHLDIVWEANLSCPNVSDGIVEYQKMEELLRLFQEKSKNPIIIKLSLATDYVRIAKLAEDIGINALDCFNSIPWDYLFPGVASPLGVGGGGVSGWLIKPFAVEGIKKIGQAGVNLPIIAGGGITCLRDIHDFKESGATGISLGSGVFLPFPLGTKELIRQYHQSYRE